MLKKGHAYLLPLILGCFILGCFQLFLANYFLQVDGDFSTIPPLQRHLATPQPTKQPQRLGPQDPNPFFTILTEEQEIQALPPRQQALRLTGIITRGAQHYALIEYGGSSQLYTLGDQLGAYRLHTINSQQVILHGEQEEICLVMEKRP